MPTFMRNINITARCANTYRENRFNGTDLRGKHHIYILNICRTPGISQEQLAHKIYINKSNVTRNLAYLEEHGYISRVPSETDKRSFLVFPTEKAFEVLPLVQDSVRDWKAYVTEGLSEEERITLDDLMEKVASRAKKYVDEHGDEDNDQ